jgi:hypothetical protein
MKIYVEWEKELRGKVVNLSKLTRSSKRDPVPGSAYTWMDTPCPRCQGRLYEMAVCCGAPEGLIECSGCDYQEKPSTFYRMEK